MFANSITDKNLLKTRQKVLFDRCSGCIFVLLFLSKKLFIYCVQILNKNIQKLVWWFAKLAYLCAPNHKRG